MEIPANILRVTGSKCMFEGRAGYQKRFFKTTRSLPTEVVPGAVHWMKGNVQCLKAVGKQLSTQAT